MNQYLRILIVDDEADCRETYKMLLESKEYAAAAAGSAEEALQLLQQEADSRQILLFTCHGRERAYLAGRADAACIRLHS